MSVAQNVNILQTLAEQALNQLIIFNSLDVDRMAKNLKTDWVVLATSGPTVDGRVIEKVWLQDMAATYKEALYSAKIWPNHERWLGSHGKVLEVKLQDATDPDLKGEIQLVAILAPSDDLVYANRRGKYTHSSIEVLKNFRGTGKFYLGGMAATDEPASVGTTELNFSADKEKFWIAGNELSFSSATEAEDEKSLIEMFTTFFKQSKGESQDTEPMSKELLEKIIDGQNKLTEALTAMGESFKTLKPAPEEKPNDDGKDKPDDKPKGEEFVSKKAFDELTENFTKLNKDFEDAKKNPVGGTKPAGDEGGSEVGVIC